MLFRSAHRQIAVDPRSLPRHRSPILPVLRGPDIPWRSFMRIEPTSADPYATTKNPLRLRIPRLPWCHTFQDPVRPPRKPSPTKEHGHRQPQRRRSTSHRPQTSPQKAIAHTRGKNAFHATKSMNGESLDQQHTLPQDRKSTRLNSSHTDISRMPSSA